MNAGDVLGGRFRLLYPIGEGGMGAVWRAHQLQLDADVAIKVLHAQTAEQPGAISRFRREAKAAAALRSPHVVQIVDYGVDEDTGIAFIAMELLEGESLARRLVRLRTLSPEQTARWVSHTARALARAHASGVVHRDLKPANIFIVENGDEELAKVLDFGIAKVMGPADGVTATATGALLGTPHYMSPEQIDPARVVDFRTDLWSLAVIACECLTGRRPFEGDTLASLAMKISLSRSELPSSLGPVPRGFDAWFARCTEPDPQRRFGSALELATALRDVVESGEPVVTKPSTAPQTLSTQHELTPSVGGVASHAVARVGAPRGRSARALGAVLVLSAAGLGGVALWGPRRGASEPEASPSGRSGIEPVSLGAALRPSAGAGLGQHADAGAPAPAATAAPRPGTPAIGIVTEPPAHPGSSAATRPKAAKAKRRPKATAPNAARPGAENATPARAKPAVDPYDLL